MTRWTRRVLSGSAKVALSVQCEGPWRDGGPWRRSLAGRTPLEKVPGGTDAPGGWRRPTLSTCNPATGLCEDSPRACDAEEICVPPDLGCVGVDAPTGAITADINRGGDPPGSDRGVESAAVNLVADTHKWATGAEIAFMNPGGVRSDLTYPESAGEGDGVVTFGEAFTFQPFGNTLQTFPMTGDQIVSALQEQCQPAGSSRPFLHLGVSEGFTYDLAKTIAASTCTSVTRRRPGPGSDLHRHDQPLHRRWRGQLHHVRHDRSVVEDRYGRRSRRSRRIPRDVQPGQSAEHRSGQRDLARAWWRTCDSSGPSAAR